MTPSYINRRQLKAEVKSLLPDAQVSPKAMVALYLGLDLVLNFLAYLSKDAGVFGMFTNILTVLVSTVLAAGFILYCMAVRQGERAEFFTLFDGFSMAGKIILLSLLEGLFIGLWSMLFVIPGIVAIYRYRFALYNLLENPDISVLQALEMSKRQTFGYKAQLFSLDISYFGWALLASLPACAESSLYFYEASLRMLSFSAMPATPSVYAALPEWGWLLLSGLWHLAVCLFYMTQQQCVELGYFEIAKATSGVSAGRQNPTPPDSDDI